MKPISGQKSRKRKRATSSTDCPPLSSQAEAAFHAYKEEQGEYAWFWRDMGYYLDHGMGFPPFSEERKGVSQQNNRARGWSGIFTFLFIFTDAPADIKSNILRSLTQDYQCVLSDGERFGEYQASLQTTGKRVKSLTRMLHRQFARGYLVWKET